MSHGGSNSFSPSRALPRNLALIPSIAFPGRSRSPPRARFCRCETPSGCHPAGFRRFRSGFRCTAPRIHAPIGQCCTSISLMGKSSTLAVASAAPMPAAAAATRQSAWCRVMPRMACERRQAPARIPSATPSGARRSPLKSRLAESSSPGRSPRQISSTEIAHVHGSVPMRRSPATRSAAGRPRSASMSTVVSSRSRAIVNPSAANHPVSAGVPTLPDRRPIRVRSRTRRRERTRCRPSVVRPRGHAGSAPRRRRSAAELPRAGRARRPARRPVLCVCAWAEVSTHKRTRRPVLAGHTQGRRAERGSTALSRAGPSCPALCFPLRGRRESPRNSRAEARVLDPLSLFSIIGSVVGTGIAGAGADGAKR